MFSLNFNNLPKDCQKTLMRFNHHFLVECENFVTCSFFIRFLRTGYKVFSEIKIFTYDEQLQLNEKRLYYL